MPGAFLDARVGCEHVAWHFPGDDLFADEHVLRDAVSEGQGEDAAKLGIVNPEGLTEARPIGARDKFACQVVEVASGIEEERGDAGGATLSASGSDTCRL